MLIQKELYQKIIQIMPIPCVDLLITDKSKHILLVKRINKPAAGQWWFPGGRIHFQETRYHAAVRKLREECALEAYSINELATFDLIFDNNNANTHSITTLFHMQVNENKVLLDRQSSDSDWRKMNDWRDENLHDFVRTGLKILAGIMG